MNANLLSSALAVIPDPKMLVNVVRLRVKQLSFGHRPLVMTAPGLGLADVALTEIISEKLTFEAAFAENAEPLPAAKVVEFPGIGSGKKAA